ncbi:MAG: M48 family metalloprotease [Candidatus Brocadiae bacterium]|nr:M48 family metalloprotease [Candidatus Brocadiia bacterium]
MRKFLSSNLVVLLFPVVVVGCEAIGMALRGDVTGAMASGTRDGIEIAGKIEAELAKTADEVNVSQEYYIGRNVAANVFAKSKRVTDPALNRYVRMVGENVAKATKGTDARGLNNAQLMEPYKGYFFAILDDNQVNAFSAPGGWVFITMGALRAMENEDELACVLAHEIGHVMDRHGIRYTMEQKKFGVPLQVLGEAAAARSPALVGELAKSLSGMGNELMSKAMGGMGVDYELTADALGARFASRAGYRPGALVDFIRRTRHGEDLK